MSRLDACVTDLFCDLIPNASYLRFPLQVARQGVVHQELHVAADAGLRAGHGSAVRLRLRVRHLQVALLAAQAGALLVN